MNKIKIVQLDPTGVIINEVEMIVDPSSKKEGSMSKSRFYIVSDADKQLGMFKIFGNDSGEIESVYMRETQ